MATSEYLLKGTASDSAVHILSVQILIYLKINITSKYIICSKAVKRKKCRPTCFNSFFKYLMHYVFGCVIAIKLIHFKNNERSFSWHFF